MRKELDQFLARILELRIVSEGELSELAQLLSTKNFDRAVDGLVNVGRMTELQAEIVKQGRIDELTVGNYVLLERIGIGGMGEVFKARHVHMDRIAAIKILRPDTLNSPEMLARFHQEVQIAGQIDHLNIVRTYDAGSISGRPYLVMDFVEGDNLWNIVLDDGPLEIHRAVDYLLQAATGLQYSHGMKIVHRDITPKNLLVDECGQVKILDMGLARIDEGIGPTDETCMQRLTQIGQALGTHAFMSPEQAISSREADNRSDVYSLGCVFYYLLTGKIPYSGNTIAQLVRAHQDNAIPYLRNEINVPEVVDNLFQKMVAKGAAFRHQSMSEVIRDLERIQGKTSQLAQSSNARARSGGNREQIQPALERPIAPAVRRDYANESAVNLISNEHQSGEAWEMFRELSKARTRRRALRHGLVAAIVAPLCLILIIFILVSNKKDSSDETIAVDTNDTPKQRQSSNVAVNLPPVFRQVGPTFVEAGETLTLSITATNADDPKTRLRYSLDPTRSPYNARIDSYTGEFRWTPTDWFHGRLVEVVVKVEEVKRNGLSAKQSFTVLIHPSETQFDQLLVKLLKSGSHVELLGRCAAGPFVGRSVSVDGQQVQVYLYKSGSQEESSASLVASGKMIFGLPPVVKSKIYYFCGDRLIAVYTGEVTTTVSLLTELFGQPVQTVGPETSVPSKPIIDPFSPPFEPM